METILRSEVLKQLDSGNLFSMEFITADRRRGTGGKLIRVENYVKHTSKPVVDNKPADPANGSKTAKKPDHYRHATINIVNPGNKSQHITKVHVPLIQIFNGKKVLNG